MTLLPHEATFPALGIRATLLTSNPETLLPAVEVVRSHLEAFEATDEEDVRSCLAQRMADLLADEFPGGFLVALGGAPAVAGDSLAGELVEFAGLSSFSSAA